MKMFLVFLSLVTLGFSAIQIELPYDTCMIDNPILEKVTEHPGFKRLEKVRMYGIAYYIKDNEPYDRFKHCVGVYHILDKAGVCFEEKLAGLLHDASHTAFSHFGDFFYKTGQDSWQDEHHLEYLRLSGLEKLLNEHGIDIESVDHKNPKFIALDKELPSLCADRIEYNLTGAYEHGLLSKQEVTRLFKDLEYKDEIFSFSDIDLAKKLAEASIFMTQNIWSSIINQLSNQMLCKIVKKAMQLKLIDDNSLWIGKDEEILNILKNSKDPYIIKGLNLIFDLPNIILDGKDHHFFYKCRAINPHIRTEDGVFVLTQVSSDYEKKFQEACKKAKEGYSYSIHPSYKDSILEYLD